VFDYDERKNSYKKWKRKGWEKTVKVICVGGGGGGGTAPKYEYGYIATSGGGGGGGAVSIGEFLAQPHRINGFEDNVPIHYGIPDEVDIWVGPGGRPGEPSISDSVDEINGTNGINGGFSRFGEYVIASGGDGGKAGIRISFEDFLYHLNLGVNIKDIINKLLLADGGKGGGKLIFTKKTETKKGRHTLYPFTNNNTPNIGLSSIYLPGGNGGVGIINGMLGVGFGSSELTNKPITDIENRITELDNKIDRTDEETQEIFGLSIILNAYNMVFNDPIYDPNGESVFYGCTGGGAGWGNGGSVFGTKYAHQFGTEYDNVSALLPQSITSGQYYDVRRGVPDTAKVNLGISNYNALGYKLGLGGNGSYPSYESYEYAGQQYSVGGSERDPIYSTFIGDLQNANLFTVVVPITEGGFPGGGGGGGIPSTLKIRQSAIFSSPTITERCGGYGGDGVVIVIGY